LPLNTQIVKTPRICQRERDHSKEVPRVEGRVFKRNERNEREQVATYKEATPKLFPFCELGPRWTLLCTMSTIRGGKEAKKARMWIRPLVGYLALYSRNGDGKSRIGQKTAEKEKEGSRHHLRKKKRLKSGESPFFVQKTCQVVAVSQHNEYELGERP